MRTVPVQIVCRKCGNPYRTTVRGGNTRCKKCRTSRHVRLDQQWEGPVSHELTGAASKAEEVAARPPVWIQCSLCDHAWRSKARDRMTIRCPECGTGQRVPYRTPENTGPSPEGYLPPPPPPRAARVRPVPVWEPYDDPDDEWEPEQERTTVAGALSGLLASLRRPTPSIPPRAAPRTARPARPAAANRPAPPPAAPRPAVTGRIPSPIPARIPGGIPRPIPARNPAADQGGIAPVDVSQLPLREQVRRDRMSSLVRSLAGSLMVWHNAPPGLCEALDTTLPRGQQRCPRTVTHGVRFFQDATEVDVFTCGAHVGPMSALAFPTPYIKAVPYRVQ